MLISLEVVWHLCASRQQCRDDECVFFGMLANQTCTHCAWMTVLYRLKHSRSQLNHFFLLFNETTQLAEISPPTTNGAAAVFTMAQMLSNWSWRPFSTDFWTCTFSAKTLSLIWISLRQCILCINTGPLHSTESQKNKIIKTQLCLYLTVPIGKSSRSLFFFFSRTGFVSVKHLSAPLIPFYLFYPVMKTWLGIFGPRMWESCRSCCLIHSCVLQWCVIDDTKQCLLPQSFQSIDWELCSICQELGKKDLAPKHGQSPESNDVY